MNICKVKSPCIAEFVFWRQRWEYHSLRLENPLVLIERNWPIYEDVDAFWFHTWNPEVLEFARQHGFTDNKHFIVRVEYKEAGEYWYAVVPKENVVIL